MKTFKIFRDINKIDSTNSEYYTVKFKIKGDPIYSSKYTDSGDYFYLKAWLNQDTWKESIKSVYDPLVQNAVFENVSKILTMSGMGSLKSKYTARKVWKDIESMTFPLSIYFQAESSAFIDVEVPIRTLQSLVVPSEYVYSGSSGNSEESLFLLPPGEPYIKSETIENTLEEIIEAGEKLTGINAKKFLPVGGSNPRILKEIEIGKFVKLRNIILESIDVDWYINDPDTSGVPLSAKVDLGLISIDLWTLKTILRLLQKHDDGDEFKTIKIEDVIESAGMNLSEILKTLKGSGKK